MSEHHRQLDPNDTRNHYCRNCGHYHGSADVRFCASCGQKNTDGRTSMGEIFHEFLHNTLHLDGKFFRMLRYLFMPGKLTAEFFMGRQKRYPHPTRFFLVVTALFLYLFNSAMHLRGRVSGGEHLPKEKYLMVAEMRKAFDALPQNLRTPEARTAVDSIISETGINPESDTINFDSFGKRFSFSTDDYARLSTDSLFKKYEVKGFYDKLVVKQSMKVADEPTAIVHAWLGTVTGTILVLLALMSPVLLLLFRRTRPYYVEHFIFLMHHTTTLLLGLSVLTLVGKLTGLKGPTFMSSLLWWFLWMTAGMMLAMRRFYHRRWGEVVWKWLVFIVLYAAVGVTAVSLGFMAAFFFMV